MFQNNSLSVKQLNFYVRSLLEGDAVLNNVTVLGEISNFKNHYQSGHLYFTLKDNDASVRCVMFKAYAQYVRFNPCDGMKVMLKGRVSLYEKDGQYQFYAEEMYEDGIGDITRKFNEIKEKLLKEGLFDQDTKRKVPKFPKRIAVVTSDTGAAVEDILNILSRRWKSAEIIMCPVAVQGKNAVPEITDALDRLYLLSDIDVIIVGRGGGSIEDLWAFNDENLARKIYESPIPVISAVGHETDFTICDFVSDLRAPTPSAAAELATPDASEISALLRRYQNNLKTNLISRLDFYKMRLSKSLASLYLRQPVDTIVNRRAEQLDILADRLMSAIDMNINAIQQRLNANVLKLDALSPLKTLARGFSSVSKDGKIIASVNQISEKDVINIKFTDGDAKCTVDSLNKNN